MTVLDLDLVLANATLVYLAAATLGIVVAGALIRRGSNRRVWLGVDLAWVLGSALSLAATVASTIQLDRIKEIRVMSDLLSGTIGATQAESSSFLSVHCAARGEPGAALLEVPEVCQPVSAFIADTRADSMISRALGAFGSEAMGAGGRLDVEGMMGEEPAMEMRRAYPATFASLSEMGAGPRSILSLSSAELFRAVQREVEFTERPTVDSLRGALDRMASSGSTADAAREAQELLFRYERIESQFDALKAGWVSLSKTNFLLLSRILAVAFIFLLLPLRVGKSVVELRQLR